MADSHLQGVEALREKALSLDKRKTGGWLLLELREARRTIVGANSLCIHPASRGVAAHTAGLFRSVEGAKGGFPRGGSPS